MTKKMKRIDFENGTVTGNIIEGSLAYACSPDFKSALQYRRPHLYCQNSEVGTAALGCSPGLCFR